MRRYALYRVPILVYDALLLCSNRKLGEREMGNDTGDVADWSGDYIYV